MKVQNDFRDILEILSEINSDETIPKNTRTKIQTTICVLQNCKNVEITIDKTIQELDNLVEDPNLPIYVKTQLWNIVSILESKT